MEAEATITETPRQLRVRPWVWVVVGILSLGAVLWTGWGIHRYWDDPKLVNFLAAWIPFVLSILIAFVPERDMKTRTKLLWRSGVIAAGFIYSVILWHQQVVTAIANTRDQEQIVAQAVSRSNQHADEKIGEVRKDLGSTASKNDLANTANAITGIVSKSQSDLANRISRLAPKPPEAAKLRFSIFDGARKTGDPAILTESIVQNKDGNYPVDVTFTNVSDAAFDRGDIWIDICGTCSLAAEIEGTDRPKGLDEHVRHMHMDVMNAGTTFQKTTLLIKSTMTPPFNFEIGFRYACAACERSAEADEEKITILALPKPL